METGEIIKKLRKEKGITQEELANVLGLQKSAIAKYENGRVKNIKRETINAMAVYFGGMDERNLPCMFLLTRNRIFMRFFALHKT